MQKSLRKLVLTAALLFTLPAQAVSLIYSSKKPSAFLHHAQNQWKTLHQPPKDARNIQVTSRGKILYSLYGIKNDWDWFELDPRTGKTTPVAKSSWFKNGFLKVLPFQSGDGAYYAKVLQMYTTHIYKVSARGPKPFLKKNGLHDFTLLSDGSYAYSVWNGRGKESMKFADYIPGRKMKLYHKPHGKKLRFMGAFDTVKELQAARGHLLFFTPETTRQKSWKLMAVPVAGKASARLVAEIDKSRSRGTPELVSWPQSPWVVFPTRMPKESYLTAPLTAFHMEQKQKKDLGNHYPFLLEKGKGAPGFLSEILTEKGSDMHRLVSYQLPSMQPVETLTYHHKQYYTQRAMYLP